eukprot:scaffold41157_cov51-Phaeocystis_antarctica.AAC.1
MEPGEPLMRSCDEVGGEVSGERPPSRPGRKAAPPPADASSGAAPQEVSGWPLAPPGGRGASQSTSARRRSTLERKPAPAEPAPRCAAPRRAPKSLSSSVASRGSPKAATYTEEAAERRAHHAGWHGAHVVAVAVSLAECGPERVDQGLAVEVAERAIARGVTLAHLQVEVLRSDAPAPMVVVVGTHLCASMSLRTKVVSKLAGGKNEQ